MVVTNLLLDCVCVCVILAQFTEMICILLNNSRYIVLRPAAANLSALLLLLFKMWVKIVSSLHVATVEIQRYAFLLFSVITPVATGVFFAFRMSCLRHATSCRHRKLFCVKLNICIKFSALFGKKFLLFLWELRVNGLLIQCFVDCGNWRRFLS